MLPLNPYESPNEAIDFAGTLYYVNPAKLSLSEHLRTTPSALLAHWNWLTWKLGLRWGKLPTARAISLAEAKCSLEAVPDFIQGFLAEQIEIAKLHGFHELMMSVNWDRSPYPTEIVLRMLHSDPQIYLEMCLMRGDGLYQLKHNVVSVAKAFRTFATSSGSPTFCRPPLCEADYLPNAPLPILLKRHLEWTRDFQESLREIRELMDLEAVVQQLDDHYRQFHVERGYWIPVGIEM